MAVPDRMSPAVKSGAQNRKTMFVRIQLDIDANFRASSAKMALLPRIKPATAMLKYPIERCRAQQGKPDTNQAAQYFGEQPGCQFAPSKFEQIHRHGAMRR